jgi:hypothetical protein
MEGNVRVCRLTDLGVFAFDVRTIEAALWWATYMRDRWQEAVWIESPAQGAHAPDLTFAGLVR